MRQSLIEIIKIVEDKRSHIFGYPPYEGLLSDSFDWLNLKMKVVGKLAKAGLKLHKRNNGD